jgi:acetolactate synthase-1/2/3 large subunit
MVRLTGGEAIFRALLPERIPFVFGVAGGKLGPVMKALSTSNAVRYVGTRHESAAAHMAAAVYAGSGRIALAMGEVGPGAVNLAAGVAHAYNNNLAMIALTSNNQHMASYPGRGMFMELDTRAVFQPISKWSAVIHDGRRIPELVRAAFREALSGRPGPAHLDVPQDILMGSFDFADDEFDRPPESYRPIGRSPAPWDDVQRAAHLLAGAERPLLIAGGGVARSGAAGLFRAVAARLGAAVTATQMGLGAVSDRAPGFAGHGGVTGGDAVLAACRDADVVLAVGCRFSSWMSDDQGPLVRPPQRLIHVDIDPMTIGRVAPVAVGLVGDAMAILDQLNRALGDAQPSPAALAWRDRIDADRQSYRAKLADVIAGSDPLMHPGALAKAIGEHLPDGALVVYDGGHTSFWSNDLTPTSEPATRFHDPGIAQLGFGLPYAVALKLAHPEAAVVNITGDGAFGFTLAELDTARRYGLPVVTIIHNNAAWGVIRLSQQHSGFTLGADLDGTDYAAIARGFGCYGETVTEIEAVGPAMARAFASGLPAVLDCRVRFVPHPTMPAFSRMGRYGL